VKTALLIPLAFVAGADGFALFAPYLVLFLFTAHLLRRRRRAAGTAASRQLTTGATPTFHR
jgi:hypothetical protein